MKKVILAYFIIAIVFVLFLLLVSARIEKIDSGKMVLVEESQMDR